MTAHQMLARPRTMARLWIGKCTNTEKRVSVFVDKCKHIFPLKCISV